MSLLLRLQERVLTQLTKRRNLICWQGDLLGGEERQGLAIAPSFIKYCHDVILKSAVHGSSVMLSYY